jgi:hypothetical protein
MPGKPTLSKLESSWLADRRGRLWRKWPWMEAGISIWDDTSPDLASKFRRWDEGPMLWFIKYFRRKKLRFLCPKVTITLIFDWITPFFRRKLLHIEIICLQILDFLSGSCYTMPHPPFRNKKIDCQTRSTATRSWQKTVKTVKDVFDTDRVTWWVFEKVRRWNVTRLNVTQLNVTRPNVTFTISDTMSPDRMSPDRMSPG